LSVRRFQSGDAFAKPLDASGPLAHFRKRFHIPKNNSGDDCVYLCGHSLGLQPKTVHFSIEQVLKDWSELGVGAFSRQNSLDSLPEALGAQKCGADGCVRLRSCHHEFSHRESEQEGDSIALVLLGGINYATGHAFDMAGICAWGEIRAAIRPRTTSRSFRYGPGSSMWESRFRPNAMLPTRH